MLQFHRDAQRTDDINASTSFVKCARGGARERWREGSVPGAALSGAVSAGKPDSQMAALSAREAEGSGRRAAAPSGITLKWTAWRY